MGLKPLTNANGLHGKLKAAARQANVFPTPKDRGMCFRVSYKWLVTGWKDEPFKGDKMNMAKAGPKQMAYLQQADKVDKAQYDAWFKSAHILSGTTLKDWGTKHGVVQIEVSEAKALTAAQLLRGQQDLAVLINFFGTSKDGAWGHAVSYYRKSGKCRYFDINLGEFSLEPLDDAAKEMQQFIEKCYVGGGKQVLDYCLYKVF